MREEVHTVLRSLRNVAGLFLILVVTSCDTDQQKGAQLHTFNIHTPEELRDFLSYAEDNQPMINTHRGGAATGYPENAIETFENTLRHTWSMMEVDPRNTSDGVVVLFHDDTLERTSTGRGRVAEHTYEELKELRLKDINGEVTEYTIPTLGEALEWARGKTILFLDNKDVPAEARVRLIQEHDARAYAVVMVYSLQDARTVYDLDPDIMMQVFMPDEQALERFIQSGIPAENIVGFVTHRWPEDGRIFELLHQQGILGVVGTSRTIEREFMRGELTEEELAQRYHQLIRMGADILEPDLGIEAGRAVERIWRDKSSKENYYIKSAL